MCAMWLKNIYIMFFVHIALIFFNITQINLRHSRNLGTIFFVRIERPAARKLEERCVAVYLAHRGLLNLGELQMSPPTPKS